MKRTISIFLALGLALAVTIVAVAAANQKVVYSDTTVMVYKPLTSYAEVNSLAWIEPQNAVETWIHPSWPTITGAKWISNSYLIEAPIGPETWRRFSKTIELCSGARNIKVSIDATADNAEAVYVNGTFLGSDGEVTGSFADNQEWNTIKTYAVSPAPADLLQLDFIVRNYTGTNSATANPTGLIFKAAIDYDCNQPPVANPGGPYLAAVGSAVLFDGSGSSDSDNDPLTYLWDFGDGTPGSGVAPTHSYNTPDLYNVCLTVNDGFVDSPKVCTLAVIYDPSAGFVTGGGWIWSSAAGSAPIYDSIPATVPGSFASIGYEATSTDEAGDYVAFAGTDRALNSVKVSLTDWACENDFDFTSGTWVAKRGGTEACVTTPGSGFNHPITLNIYEVDHSGPTPAVGSLLASKTQTFFIPFRPSWDSNLCPGPESDVPFGGKWFDPVLNKCVHGYAFNIDFDFTADGIILPDEVIYGVAYNTAHYGASPLVVNGPYNSLNLSLSTEVPSIGTDAEPGTLFLASSWGGAYCDGGVGGLDIFRRDAGCWAPYAPVVQFNVPTEGAYKGDQLLEGKATFGFVSKYKKGATVPEGATEFQFKDGNLNFHSTSYEWLVVTGGNYAKFKGEGTINGQGNYKFQVWAGDRATDTFRIRIWSEDEMGVETVVYDNGRDQPIGGGSIVVHNK